MSIKYNKFGEVISVNGLTTGHHLGKPMQDAAAKKPEHNEAYAIAKKTIGNSKNSVDDNQPEVIEHFQADWDQNDETAPDYVKNRTHYEKHTIDKDSYREAKLTAGTSHKCNSRVPAPNKIEAGATFFGFIDGELVYTAPIGSSTDFEYAFLTMMDGLYSDKVWIPAKTDRKTGKRCLDITVTVNRDCTIRYGYAYPSELKKLDPKFLPEGYPYMGEGEITRRYDSSEFTTLTLQDFPSFKVGDIVSIKVDGIGYSLVAFMESINGFDYIVIGDSSYDLENKTGKYGWQVYVPPEEELILFCSSGIHTVSWNVPKVYPIDPKFLPEGIGGDVLGVVITEDESLTLTCNKTYEEIMEALTNNVLVFATFVKHNGDHFEQRHFGCVRKYLDYSEVIFEGGGQSAVRINSDNNVWIDAPM